MSLGLEKFILISQKLILRNQKPFYESMSCNNFLPSQVSTILYLEICIPVHMLMMHLLQIIDYLHFLGVKVSRYELSFI